MMDRSSASAFVYAKASALLAKSFTGANAKRLFSVKSLKELYSLLFDNDPPPVPEVLLAKEIESKAVENFHNLYSSLLSNFSKPEKILSEIVAFYEKENSSCEDISDGEEAVRSLWNSVKELPAHERSNLESFIKTEISMKNILWALRLKVFYKLSSEEILNKLAYSDNFHSKNDILAGEAIAILDKDPSLYDDWKNWKYSEFLNPHEEGAVWEIDPCWIEKAARRSLLRHYQRSFHKEPMSILSLVSWFKIKENELDYIRAVAEGLRLDVEQEKIKEAAGVL